MEAHDEVLAEAMARANEVFGRLTGTVEEAVKEAPAAPIDLLEVAHAAGLELDEGVLTRLELPNLVYPLSWLPWHEWWPYQPLWCWWWERHYPWVRCGPYLLVRRSSWPARPASQEGTEEGDLRADCATHVCCGSGRR
jgi:hypothetical protein